MFEQIYYFYVYNRKSRMKLPVLYKRATTGKIVEWFIEVEKNKYRTTSGFTDGQKVTSLWTECFGKNIGKANATSNDQQALAEAKAIHKKRIEAGSFENIKDIDNPTFFQPMLAKDYIDKDTKEILVKIKFPVFSQPKLDGIRCIIKADGMWTRKGKPLVSAPHVYETLIPFFEKNPDLILDGELYCDKFADDFNKIISMARKTKPTKDDLAESKKYLKLFAYDLPSSDKNFYDRYTELCDLDLPKSVVSIVETMVVHNEEEQKEAFTKYVEQGYEGQILRVDAPYENKRTKSLLKYKEFITEEFTVLGMEEGVGNMSGKVSKLYFKTKDGKEFDAAVNGTWEYLAELLKAKDLIGKEGTVRFQNYTPEGAPRFGKVIEIRDYE